MGEKKKIIFAVIISIAIAWFLFANFCLPIAKDNAKLLFQYRQLKTEVKTIEGLTKDKLDVWVRKMSTTTSNLEKKFLGQGRMKLTEQLARKPLDSDIVFTNISQKETEEKEGYQVFPVDISIRTQFHDLIKYLVGIESNPLMIGVNSLQIRKFKPEEKNLDIKVSLLGFRLTRTSEPTSKYLKEKYGLFDEERFKRLLESVESVKSLSPDKIAELYNPFISVYGPELSYGRKTGEAAMIDGFSLQGTLRIGDKRITLINGAIFREGDEISGMRVMEIRDGKVILMRSGKTYILKMGVDDEFIKP